MDKYKKMLLKQLKRPDALATELNPKKSLQDHITGWKKEKENRGGKYQD